MLIGDASVLQESITKGLLLKNRRIRQISNGVSFKKTALDRYEANLTSELSLSELRKILLDDGDSIGTVINLLPLNGDLSPAEIALCTFNTIKCFQSDLLGTASSGGGNVFNVTNLDGHFGLKTRSELNVVGAGSLGICKTLSHECSDLCVRCIDVDPTLPADVASAFLLNEFELDAADIEIGLDSKGRWRLSLTDASEQQVNPALPEGDQTDVVLITGGAYGITAEAAKELARQRSTHFILIGRSQEPTVTENPETEASELRNRFIAEMRKTGQRLPPSEIEKRVQRVLKDNVISANLAEIKELGCSYEYHSLDVRDEKAFASLIEDVYELHGRIDGVIHGAGVIEDKLLLDKTSESFERVFRTKVDSANVLAAKLRPNALRYLAFFSSVSGRFGNTGQSDYSAANEYLNKLANQLNGRWPTRVVALNWGPWDAGMVSEHLRELYALKGIRMIDIRDGVQIFKDELQIGSKAPAEVIVSCSLDAMISGTTLGTQR